MGVKQWIDRQIAGMGYVKADEVRGGPQIGSLWRGEAPLFGPRDLPMMDDENQQRTERLTVTSSWAYSDINLIASEFARASFGVYEQTEESLEEMTAHPFEVLLAKPNKFTDHSFLLRYTMTWLQLRGEAYWWLVDDNAGELAQIWHIPSSRMRPVPDKEKYISGYAYQPRHGQRPITIPPEKVCFFRLPNPFDFHRGLAPLSALRLALETDYSAAQWNKETFDKEATLRTLISVSADINLRDYMVAKEELERELVEERRRFFITRAGDVKAEQFGLSHKDLEFLSGRAFTQQEIDRVFGVPGGLWAKDATYANAQAAQSLFINSTVYPLHVLMAEAITAQIIRPRYGDNLRGQFEDIRPLDRKLLVTERRQYWQVKTVDEARADLGLTELEDTALGGTLVPLATKPAQVGGAPFMSAPIKSNGREMREDLRRWQSVALRRLRDGEVPGGYDFVSEHIPTDVAMNVKAALSKAGTEQEVKAAFAARFQCAEADHDHRRLDWSAYP